jgi:signal transduction histidine kinase
MTDGDFDAVPPALERLERETRRLIHLTENVLWLARRGREGTAPHRWPTDVAAETRRLVDEFRPVAAARRATIVMDSQGESISLLDRDALRHVVLNLLDNATKYGPIGQTIRVGVHNADGAARVSVADQGPGVPPSEQDLIWQAFRRGSGAMRQGTGGSGMGLTIVRDIVVQHGGRTRIENAPGAGAIFTVEFPCLVS